MRLFKGAPVWTAFNRIIDIPQGFSPELFAKVISQGYFPGLLPVSRVIVTLFPVSRAIFGFLSNVYSPGIFPSSIPEVFLKDYSGYSQKFSQELGFSV
jgi:hypothetical protein